MQLRHLSNPLSQQHGSFTFMNYFIYNHNWCHAKVGNDHELSDLLEIQNSPNMHPRFSIDPWGGIGLEAGWLAKMQTCGSSNNQLLEGVTHNTWQMRGVNQTHGPPSPLSGDQYCKP